MHVSDYDYHLPPHLIAQTPAEPRDSARLLVVDRAARTLGHHTFHELPELLRPGDVLVANDSRVLPARLYGRRPTGGAVEVLLLREDDDEPDVWRALVRPGRRVRAGDTLVLDGFPPATALSDSTSPGTAGFQPANTSRGISDFQPAGSAPTGSAAVSAAQGTRPSMTTSASDHLLTAVVLDRLEDGERRLRLRARTGTVRDAIHRVGVTPLPPYIHAPLRDPERYQTVYARAEGSVAAPTAGLHFTMRTLQHLRERDIALRHVTLHVGAGTFKPMAGDDVSEHVMHSEWADVDAETVTFLNRARGEGRRVIAVGTTSVRVLESAAAGGELRPFSGWTDLFIRPGYTFHAVDGLITNFHLPRSTLLLLVSAFAGKELIDDAYAAAIAQEYRFYSFGDAMLIL